MALSVLSRYLDPEVLRQIAERPLQPKHLVIGNQAGEHKSPLSGFAVEFAGHREYVPGDDPKHIDWRVYFTRDRFFIKQYELETNFVCHLLLDVSASMRYGDLRQQKLLYAAQMATTMAYCILRQSDKASLVTFDDQVRGVIPPSSSLDQIVRMTQHLDEIEPTEKTDMSDCLNELAQRIGRREIVMIFSDFLTEMESLESAIQRLRYQDHEVVLFHILHPDEVSFPFDIMTKFVGLEVDERLLAQPEELRENYLRVFSQFVQQLEDIVQRNQCERVPVETNGTHTERLLDYLNKRQALRRSR